MKEKLIALAKEKGFESEFLHNTPYKYSTKETLRWYFWLCELQKWLRDKHSIYVFVKRKYSNKKSRQWFKYYMECHVTMPSSDKYATYTKALECGLDVVLNFESVK